MIRARFGVHQVKNQVMQATEALNLNNGENSLLQPFARLPDQTRGTNKVWSMQKVVLPLLVARHRAVTELSGV